jgi:hypothetical protein
LSPVGEKQKPKEFDTLEIFLVNGSAGHSSSE